MLKQREQQKTLTESADFWLQPDNAQAQLKKLKVLENKIANISTLENKCDNISFLIELYEIEPTIETQTELEKEVVSSLNFADNLKTATLLNGEYDSNPAIVTIHAGSGGTESQDWADMLLRMYARFCERNNFEMELTDCVAGTEAGIKSVEFIVRGENAYGVLSAEKGVHRLVRISPFDSNARRHTSFASVEVIPEIEDVKNIEISPDDLRIDTYRASGAGGQHINKTDSAVRITHLPTGIVVSSQSQRSQIQNRETAYQMLVSKLISLQIEQKKENIKQIQGEVKANEWGSQIRSYVMCPYTMVKDHRTNYETSNVSAVLDGEIMEFINAFLKQRAKGEK